MVDVLKVRTLFVEQDKTPLFSFFLTGVQLLRIAEISRIKRNNEGKLALGLSKKRSLQPCK